MTLDLSKVRDFAIMCHDEQKRRYTDEPYYTHLDNVVRILTGYGHSHENVIAAAYLHDIVEDTHVTIKDLIKLYPERVVELVYWLTDKDVGNRESRKLQQIWRISSAPLSAQVIKCADLMDNAYSIWEYDKKFAPVYLQEAKDLLVGMQSKHYQIGMLHIYKRAYEIICNLQ